MIVGGNVWVLVVWLEALVWIALIVLLVLVRLWREWMEVACWDLIVGILRALLVVVMLIGKERLVIAAIAVAEYLSVHCIFC